MRKASSLEKRFLILWESVGGHPLQTEFRFHPERKWRFDFAIPEKKIAIELEGGVWSGGRHTSGIGFVKDCEKYNAATMDGWSVIRLTTQQCKLKYINDLKIWIEWQ